jgi:hypothetical protein
MSNKSTLIIEHDAKITAKRPNRCETCANSHFESGQDQGACHLNPPVATFIPIQTRLGGQGLALQAGWPPVLRDNFCVREFAPIPPASEA